jgi:sec-independent protein translocase protein TatC
MSEPATKPKTLKFDLFFRIFRFLRWPAIVFFVSFLVSFVYAGELFDFLVLPFTTTWSGETERRIIFTALHQKFFTEIRIAAFFAIFACFPFALNRTWVFVAKRQQNDKSNSILPFLITTPILFLVGGAFGYFVLLPIVVPVFAEAGQVGGDSGLALISVSNHDLYLSMAMFLIAASAWIFEIPVLLAFLARTDRQRFRLTNNRRSTSQKHGANSAIEATTNIPSENLRS